MKTDAQSKILKLIEKNGKARITDLVETLSFSPQVIHRHIKVLQSKNLIQKVGGPPVTFYVPVKKMPEQTFLEISPTAKELIENEFLYVTPDGHLFSGLKGFQRWVIQTKQEKQYMFLASEYENVRTDANHFFSKNLIEASGKFSSTFKSSHLDSVYYADFYSLPKFGKTKLGSLVLYAKQAQDKKRIKEIAEFCKPRLEKLIKDHKIDAIGWVPHSIPRKVSFLKELEKNMDFKLPTITILKAYSGELPIAQKSLSKLEERIENARNTIFIKENEIPFKRILLIDDAVGSGSTLESVAEKVKNISPKTKVFGFAIVGSLKGFEVIREV